jgi:hypothetical protein
MCSRRIGSRADTNLANLPVETSAAPITSTGGCGTAPQVAISSKSMYLRKSSWKSVKVLRLPSVMNDIIV